MRNDNCLHERMSLIILELIVFSTSTIYLHEAPKPNFTKLKCIQLKNVHKNEKYMYKKYGI